MNDSSAAGRAGDQGFLHLMQRGDLLPLIHARGNDNPRYALYTAAGRPVVLCYVGSLNLPGMREIVAGLRDTGRLFDDDSACCFVISADPADATDPLMQDRLPGLRVLWDDDGAIGRMLGCIPPEGGGSILPATFLFDAGMRVSSVLAAAPTDDDTPADASSHIAMVRAALAGAASADVMGWAPVIAVPNILEPGLCEALIAYAREEGLEDSGFMRTDPATGRTILVVDHGHKRRSDRPIEDERLRDAVRYRIKRRLVPQIERAFQFRVTRIERDIVACYDAGDGGWFRPHKDNTTLGTAHRRFAVSINLNAEDYDGGDLVFPEFGRRTYRAPTGGAVVFSCSLLHEVKPITRGLRYCVLPFLYDDAAAELRRRNAENLDDPALRDSVRRSLGGM